MESLQGPVNPILVGEGMKTESIEPGSVSSCSSGLDVNYEALLPYYHHHMPFLQLLQGAMRAGDETEEEEDQLLQFYIQQQQQQTQQEEQERHALLSSCRAQQSNIQLLLRLQNQQQQQNKKWPAATTAVEQLESCVTHASESEARRACAAHIHSPRASSATARCATAGAPAGPRPERKKRKRSRAAAAPSKSTEEAESQRMAHITVERNRRRLMNDHLAVLRSLMPPSFIQRGDQASIIGGAIEFIKELEHNLLALQAEKRLRASGTTSPDASSRCTKASDPGDGRDEEDGASFNEVAAATLHGGFFISPQYTSYTESLLHRSGDVLKRGEEEESPEILGVDVEATVVQGHVNLKVAGRRRAGQLVAAVAAMEELRLSVLHLNIVSLDRDSILYSLNLKMEDGCKLGSAEEIATAVYQIFSYINACSNSSCCC